MTIKISDLNEEHPLVCAGRRMVSAHRHFYTAGTAVKEVSKEFPDVEPELLIALWVGINCKSREAAD